MSLVFFVYFNKKKKRLILFCNNSLQKDFMDNVAGDFTRMNVFLTEVLKTCQV